MMTRAPVGQSLLWAVLAAVTLVAGPVGCGKQEIDALRGKVMQLESELADAQGKLADVEQALEEARVQAEKSDTKEEALVEQLTKIRVERDTLKQEIVALKKRR